MDLLPFLPALAPLAQDQVLDLLGYRERLLPRGREGRPPRGTADRITRQEQRQRQALDSVLSDIIPARQRIFELLLALVDSGRLTRRTLLDILYPEPLTPYHERLNEWAREKFLWFDAAGNPAPNPTGAILIQRELDPRKRKLPPPRSEPRSFFCWRLNSPGSQPVPYEMPLVPLDTARYPVYQERPEPGAMPYILITAWKGASLGDPAWIVLERGVARWVGEPGNEQLDDWVSPHEQAALLVSPGAEGQGESRAVRVLRLQAAKHLLSHDSTSEDSTPAS